MAKEVIHLDVQDEDVAVVAVGEDVGASKLAELDPEQLETKRVKSNRE